MSVLIKGMNEMPEDGAVLVVRHDDNGKAYIKFACTYGYSMELVKLPEQHGRLIDENDVIELLSKGWKLSVYPNAANVHGLKGVIEAEGE